MKKKLIAIIFTISAILILSTASYATPVFDMYLTSTVTDSYDYKYELFHGNTDRGISHWWLEINCGHSTIDRDSIYGYTMIGDLPYFWTFEFNDNISQVGDYTDWVIKWDAPEFPNDYEIPKDNGTFIGYFGFHSTNPPVSGNWGGKGGTFFDNGTTVVPQSRHCPTIPEPASMALFGLGMIGFGILRRKRK